MGQCVLRDCGLETSKPPKHLETYLKEHMQEQFFDTFLQKKINNPTILIKDVDFNSSLEYPQNKSSVTILPKKKNFNIFEEEKHKNILEKLEKKEKEQQLETKKITPLINKEKTEFNFSKLNNSSCKNIYSDRAFDEDLLGGSLSYNNDDLKKSYQKSKFNDSLKINNNDQSISNMFQNQIFENFNSTPSGTMNKSDEENLGEYEKIFQDDEFNDSYVEEDYIKKIKRDN